MLKSRLPVVGHDAVEPQFLPAPAAKCSDQLRVHSGTEGIVLECMTAGIGTGGRIDALTHSHKRLVDCLWLLHRDLSEYIGASIIKKSHKLFDALQPVDDRVWALPL